jgi:predicted metal-dependent hydrolase
MFKIFFRRKRITNKGTSKSYLLNKEAARKLVHERLEYFNQHYNLSYFRVSIKNTKTKWGSCSSKKNLNFSYRIVFLRPELQDYLIVHELCHLSQMNHGEGFWSLVEETIPHAKRFHKELRATQVLE